MNDKIVLQADNGKYVVAQVDNGQKALYATGNSQSEAEVFDVIIVDEWPTNSNPPTINLKSGSEYVTLHGDTVVLDGAGAVNERVFKVLWRGVGGVVLQAANNKYVSRNTDGSPKLKANRDLIGPWESFAMIKVS